MAKLELKGMILTVNQPETVGEKNTKKQTFILKIPAYRDEYGDIRGKDEEWEIAVMGDNVDKFAMTRDHQGKKAKCSIYLNGQKYTKKSDNTEGWIINATLAEITYADATAAAPAQTQTASGTGAEPKPW
ncbi:DUF3127 domain-containing protein [Pedobacter ginsengisoli]|uniref:DUF3127 domain-containing protein n=1 Tax=Pedobacter ginsengisoli TaxID=363852 RepID=UPI00254FD4B7|nr:DUF3127 domain-containing protein [Pedobacter ginsengisoli]